MDVLRAENQLNVDLLASRDLQHQKELLRLKRQIESKESKVQESSSKVETLKAAHTNIVKGAARSRDWMRSAELTALRAKNLARNRLKTVQKLSEKLRVAVEAHEMSEAKSAHKFVCTKTDDHGQPFSPPFEEHSRRLLSTGMSAEQCRRHVILNSKFMLHGEALENFVVPSLSWFQKQRETVGLHSWSCAMLAIAGPEAVGGPSMRMR